MRGDHAPLGKIRALVDRYDPEFAENAILVTDDSHGVGALGISGRGTEEITAPGCSDLLVGTLGKAFGVNGGYVAGPEVLIRYLRQTSPFYIYSNPITPAEAAAAIKSVDIVDGPEGSALLEQLDAMTKRFRQGLAALGLETLPGQHPVVPLMIRDTDKTARTVEHLKTAGILATGLGYPVVPKGQEEIRFQVCADHTAADIDEVLAALGEIPS
jgi:glycine C-acetyltransferase